MTYSAAKEVLCDLRGGHSSAGKEEGCDEGTHFDAFQLVDED
jgi:hypothetical protein